MKYTLRSLMPKRRWYQFSLKTLLIVITAICIGPGGYVAYEQKKARNQMAAVEEIENIGGRVMFDSSLSSRSATMRLILGDESFGNVHSVEFDGGVKVTDAHLTPLADISNLKILHLQKTHVTDEGLVHLYGLSKLRYLFLPPPYNTHVTQEGIDKLQQALPNCEISR